MKQFMNTLCGAAFIVTGIVHILTDGGDALGGLILIGIGNLMTTRSYDR